MRMTWNIGRVAGIDLYLHSTFVLLLIIVGLTQASLTAVLFISALFGCVVLHELGHALMARHYGIGTRDITLYPIGGVARLERMPRAPGAEILIALAGPAVNVLIVVGLGLVLWTLRTIDPFTGGGTLAVWTWNLLAANLILALFNLVPAFPMDGGRVFRAALSGWLGRGRATETAAMVGRGLAVVFGIFCLINGLFIPVILAAFIYIAAGAELAQVRAEERLLRPTRGAEGVWTAPPGYSWVHRGNGVWQLSPVVVPVDDPDFSPSSKGHPSWH